MAAKNTHDVRTSTRRSALWLFTKPEQRIFSWINSFVGVIMVRLSRDNYFGDESSLSNFSSNCYLFGLC